MTSKLEKMANIAARKISHDSNDWGLITAGYLAGAKAVLEFAREISARTWEHDIYLVAISDLEEFVEGDKNENT